MEIKRLFDILSHCNNVFDPKNDILAGKENGKWVKYNIEQYIESANNISYGLIKLGIKKNDKIATISNNRPEWNFLDMGISQIGAIHVPIYPTISESDYNYILNHAEVKYVFVSGMDLLRKIKHILPEIPSLKGIYTFKKIDTVNHLTDLIELGEKNAVPDELEKIKSSIEPHDTATLIYTSGTTGDPKGVMLSHSNIISNVMAVKDIPPINQNDRALSYLPLCHIYERTLTYLFQYLGVTIYYAENMGTIADNIKEVKPSVMSTVPRFLEKIYDRIITRGQKLKGLKKWIFFWSINIGLRYELHRKNGWWYEIKLKIAKKLVFNKWKEALGGHFKVMVSGGAALQERLCRIFNAAGIPLVEGYGLTETSPVIAVNNFELGGQKFGTVGPVLKNVKVKIAEDGEILCKGPNVMQGYYRQPKLTQEVIDKNGWFHTGDIGILDEDNFLKITGRKKEIFKTSLGKYISPQLLENKFKESPFIENIVVLGENQKYAAALIVPEFEYLKNWCKEKEIEYTNNEKTIANPLIKKQFQKEIDKYNQAFGKTEQISRFELIGKTWSIETGELTANLKVKRNFIVKQYKEQVDKLFR